MTDFNRRTTITLPDFLHEPYRNLRAKVAACFDTRASAGKILRYDSRWVPAGGQVVGVVLPNKTFQRVEQLQDISVNCARLAVESDKPVPAGIIPATSFRDMYVRALVYVLESVSPKYVAYERERVLDEAKKAPYKLPKPLIEYCRARRPDVIAAIAQKRQPADQSLWIDHALRAAGKEVEPMLLPDVLRRAILGQAITTGLHTAIAHAYDHPDKMKELSARLAAVAAAAISQRGDNVDNEDIGETD